MKVYPSPRFWGYAATITGNEKENAAFASQFENEPIEEALALIAFGKSSDNSTHTVTPDEAQKENANPIININNPNPWYPTRVNIPNKAKNSAILNEPISNNLLRPTLSIKNMPIIVAIRFVAPIITVCQIAESVEKPTDRKISAL